MQLPQFATYQVQIFISLTLVLGGILVALLCDYLKGNNELLREQNLALKQRAAELRKQDRKRTMSARAASVALKQPGPVANIPAAKMEVKMDVAEQVVASAPAPVVPMLMVPAPAESAAQKAPEKEVAAVTVPAVRRASRSNGAPRRPISAEAMAAMERGAAMASAKRPMEAIAHVSPRVSEEIELPVGVTSVEVTSVAGEIAGQDVARKEAAPELLASAASQPSVQSEPSEQSAIHVSTSQSGSKRNWNALLAQRSQHNSPAAVSPSSPSQLRPVAAQSAPLATAPAATVQAATVQAIDAQVPAGFYDGYVLTRLLQSHKPVSGLVVSIGVSAAQPNGEADLAAVRNMIQSLMGPLDFAAASAPDEYLLIFPNERGASAQRRLSEIAKSLWDFQLGTLGRASILFSWGGLEVRGELIEDAIASATERMQETRRGRAPRSFDSGSYKVAV